MRAAELRTVCSFIALTVPVDAGKENPLVTAARQISLGEGTEAIEAPDEPAQLSSSSQPGDFERFTATFGRAFRGA